MPALNLTDQLNLPKLAAYLKLLDKQLVLVAKSAGPSLRQPLLRTVKAKSKRLRPALLYASTLGETTKTAVAGGAAIELLHLGSLVHDDILDNSEVRWGAPTIYSQNQATALLAGDYLLAQAGGQAAKLGVAAAKLIADTTSTLILGESQEQADTSNLSRGLSSYISCIEAKTGALTGAACALGGICAGLSASEIKALARYGKNLGISFQLVDDLLDVLSTSQLMGKPVGRDASHGTYTLPVLLSLRGNNRAKLIPLLKKTTTAKALASFLIEDGSISESVGYVRKYNQMASRALSGFSNQPVSGLASLPDAYFNWALNKLVVKDYRSKLPQNY
jgi:geranylgeranyl pyrophosphate synthase